MSQRYGVSKLVLAVVIGLSSLLILNEAAAANTLNSKSGRVARRASRRGTRRARCKSLFVENNGSSAKASEACPFIHPTN